MKLLKVEDYMNLPYTIETKRENDGSYFIKVKNSLAACLMGKRWKKRMR